MPARVSMWFITTCSSINCCEGAGAATLRLTRASRFTSTADATAKIRAGRPAACAPAPARQTPAISAQRDPHRLRIAQCQPRPARPCAVQLRETRFDIQAEMRERVGERRERGNCAIAAELTCTFCQSRFIACFRQAPQPAPDAGRWPFFEHHCIAVAQHQHPCAARRHRFFRPRGGQLTLPAGHIRHAIGCKRAAFAVGLAAHAQRRAEIHQPLGIGAHVGFAGVGRQQRFGQRPHGVFDTLFARETFDAEYARQHTLYVAVENRCARAECKRRDRSRRRAANAGQLSQRLDRSRKRSAMQFDHRLRAAVQIAGARVVAKTGPQGHHIVDRRRGQCGNIRKTRQKTRVIGDHRRHLGSVAA